MQASPFAIQDPKPKTPNQGQSDQFVRVRVGQLELTMDASHLAGVHQVSRQNRLTTNNTVLTQNGELPLVRLSNVLSQSLNTSIGDDSGRALIAVESDGVSSMILVDSVSRPVKVKPEHVHPIPNIAVGEGKKLIRSMLNIDPTSDNPSDSVRYCFDPRVAVGLDVRLEPSDKPNPLPKEAVSAIAVAVAASKRSGTASHQAGQLLAFIPEDIPTGDVEHVFCLPLNAIAEVVTTQQNLNDSITNDFFNGFVLWRTVPVPIIRLGKIFGFNSEDNLGGSRRLVVARAPGNRFIGFYSKPQMQTMRVPESVPGKDTAFKGRPHLGCFRTELGEVVVPDMTRIINGEF